MKLIEFEMMFNFIATMLTLIAFTTYLVSDGGVYFPLSMAALLTLCAAKWVDLADRWVNDSKTALDGFEQNKKE